MSARVLYIEDEEALASIVAETLATRGYRVEHYVDGTAARRVLAKADQFDLVLLDVMLPWKDGLSLARQLRVRHPRLPILFLTAKTQAADVVAGFEAGGNDYLRKPFSLEELVARMENLLRARPKLNGPNLSPEGGMYVLGGLRFDYSRLTLWEADGSGARTRLSHREGELLRYLCERVGETVDRHALLRALWGDDAHAQSRSLDVYVRKLRRALAGEPAVELLTLRGVGYRFVVGVGAGRR